MKIAPLFVETFEEFTDSFHIVVLFDKKDSDKIDYLTEGKWVESEEKGYWVRLDKPKFDFDKLHAHIAKSKHVNSKNKQVAWNDDGTRHDRKTFNKNFDGMERAKQIARKSLGLAADFQLESISDPNTGKLLLESVEYLPSSCNLYVFEAGKMRL
jgi:hypothetical protein